MHARTHVPTYSHTHTRTRTIPSPIAVIIAIAQISHEILVDILLAGIADVGAVVAGVSKAVAIRVLLVLVGRQRAVVLAVEHA